MCSESALIREDFESPRFLLGAQTGRWSLINLAPPVANVEVNAQDRTGAPSSYLFRFDLTNYPHQAPTAQLWDRDVDAALDPSLWPTGGRASIAFNPSWRTDAIYLPCDRAAQQGHETWQTQSSSHWWGAGSTIVDYLSQLSSILDSSHYVGTANAR